MPSTQNFSLPYPLASDAPAGSEQLKILADATDAALTGVNAKSEHNEQNHNNNTDRLVKVENRLVTIEDEVAAAATDWDMGPFSYLLSFYPRAGTKFTERKWWYTHITNLTRGPNPFRPSELQGVQYPLNFHHVDALVSGYGGWYMSFDIAWYVYQDRVSDELKLALMPRRTWTMPSDKYSASRRYWVKLWVRDSRSRGGQQNPGLAPKSTSLVDTGMPIGMAPEVFDDLGNPIAGIQLPDVTNDVDGTIEIDMGGATAPAGP